MKISKLSEPQASAKGVKGDQSPLPALPCSRATAAPDDQRVLDKVKLKPTGASAIDIARASLGWRAKRHSVDGLTMIGLSIAARLVGDGLIAPTRSNRFILVRKEVAA